MKKLDNRSLVAVIGHKRIGGVGRCVKSFIKQLGRYDQTLIINNQATKNVGQEIDKLKNKYKKVRVIKNTNSNIAAARNLAISYAKKNGFKYCLFLDDDCEAEKNWQANMLDAAINSDSAVVIIGNVKYYPKDSIFSILEEQLWKGWVGSGRFGNRVGDIDTKNCLLNIYRLEGVVFDKGKNQNGRRADIKLAMCLNKAGKKIYFSEKSIVKHFERSTFLSYLKKRVDLVNSDKTIGYSIDSPKPPTNSGIDHVTILGKIFWQLLITFRIIDGAKLILFILLLGSYKLFRKLV